MNLDYVAAARASRRAQGLPDRVDDAAALAKVAALLAGPQRESAGRDATTGALNNNNNITSTTTAAATEAGSRHGG